MRFIINAIATETAHFYHDTHFTKRKFQLEIAKVTNFKGNEGQFTTVQTAEGNLRWRFHSLRSKQISTFTTTPPINVLRSFLPQHWHNKKKSVPKTRIHCF